VIDGQEVEKDCPVAMSLSKHFNELSIRMLVKWWESVFLED
jgi:hypothetical protein